MGQNFQVVKASGVMEPFNEEKLRKSLRRSGADEVLINQIIQELAEQWHEGITTKSIFKRAFKMLKRRNRPYAARYTLKQAMFDFGPSGFPFEDFVAEVMKSQGYEVETRQLLPGACIRHEMDVVAQKEDRLIWLECKYHPIPGSVSNVKVPLYVHSRFRDLEQQQNGNGQLRGEGWIVTNTRFSEDAMAYGRCAGMRLIGWNYPSNGSLREMVDRANLHPVTCLTYLTRQEKNKLLENGIVLSSTLSRPGGWSDLLHLSNERRNKIMSEAQSLCGNT
ncbi:MAG: restriction endonuclease [Saprospiraceae bacterium]|nr:restriction endonuclease [Saprospiraceae bacterium]